MYFVFCLIAVEASADYLSAGRAVAVVPAGRMIYPFLEAGGAEGVSAGRNGELCVGRIVALTNGALPLLALGRCAL